METFSRYRHLIMRMLSDLVEASAQGEVEILPLFDTAHDNYLVLDAGWDGVRRIHHIIAHLWVYNGKIWVEVDNTNTGIVQ